MRMFLPLAAALVTVAGTSFADAQDLAVKPSKYTVKETIDRIVADLDKRGIKPVARVDHAAGAKAAGLEMKPAEVIIFGNPKVGTPLMLANPETAIDLPMRVVAYEDKAGKVWVGYVKPDALRARHQLTGVEDQLKAMAGALDAITKAGTE